jgi:hypothetical protein
MSSNIEILSLIEQIQSIHKELNQKYIMIQKRSDINVIDVLNHPKILEQLRTSSFLLYTLADTIESVSENMNSDLDE